MAVVYKNARLVISSTYTTVYTCPASTTAMVLLAQVANVGGYANYVSARWLDASAANAPTHITKSITVPPQSAQGLLDGPLVLEAGDQLQCADESSTGFGNPISLEITLTIREES